MKSETLEKTEQKFFFDQNVFDEAEAEADPSLVLAYNQHDLQKAQDAAVQEGKAAGQKQALESIEKQTQTVLQQIQSNFAFLLGEEEKREQRFETEVLSLCSALMSKLFPYYKMYVSKMLTNPLG